MFLDGLRVVGVLMSIQNLFSRKIIKYGEENHWNPGQIFDWSLWMKNESLSIKIRNQTFVNGLKKGKTDYMAETFEFQGLIQ